MVNSSGRMPDLLLDLRVGLQPRIAPLPRGPHHAQPRGARHVRASARDPRHRSGRPRQAPQGHRARLGHRRGAQCGAAVLREDQEVSPASCPTSSPSTTAPDPDARGQAEDHHREAPGAARLPRYRRTLSRGGRPATCSGRRCPPVESPAGSAPPACRSLSGWWTRRPLPPVSPSAVLPLLVPLVVPAEPAGWPVGSSACRDRVPGKNYIARVSLAETDGLGSIETHRISWRLDVAPRLLHLRRAARGGLGVPISPDPRPERSQRWAGPRGASTTTHPAEARARDSGGPTRLRPAAKTEVARLPLAKGSEVQAPGANGVTSLTVVPDPGLGETP